MSVAVTEVIEMLEVLAGEGDVVKYTGLGEGTVASSVVVAATVLVPERTLFWLRAWA
jgi:hypothetical protein